MLYPVWPATLTDASWQKKKGSVAKIAGKTGVGEAMKAAKAAFDRLDFNSVEASQIPKPDWSVEHLAERKEAVMQWHRSTVEPVREKVKEVRDCAARTAAAWQKNKLIPKDARKAAEDVQTEADQLWIALKGNSVVMTTILDDYDTKSDVCRKLEADERAKITSSITNLKKALQEVLATPTRKGWSEGAKSPHQRCRSMCNAIRAIPSLKAHYWSEWQPYGNEYHKAVVEGSEDEMNDVRTMVKTVARSLKSFESGYQAFMQD